MTPYLIAGIAVLLTAGLTAWAVFAYRSGRNNARVRAEQQESNNATQSAEAAQRMLEARTNGIRNDSELLSTLDKGKF